MPTIFTFQVNGGKVFQRDEKVSNAKLNQLGVPTVTCSNVDDALAPTLTGQVLVYDQATGLWGAGSIGAAFLPLAQGATVTTAGVTGSVPPPLAGQQAQFLRGDMTYADPPQAEPINLIYPFLLFR